MPPIETFLTLPTGISKEASHFYVTIFPDSTILDEKLVGEGERETQIVNFKLSGTTFTFMDMKKDVVPALNWATSLLYYAKDKQEFDFLFEKLKLDGKVMMGPESMENIGIALCCWVVDRFNITWQLVLRK